MTPTSILVSRTCNRCRTSYGRRLFCAGLTKDKKRKRPRNTRRPLDEDGRAAASSAAVEPRRVTQNFFKFKVILFGTKQLQRVPRPDGLFLCALSTFKPPVLLRTVFTRSTQHDLVLSAYFRRPNRLNHSTNENSEDRVQPSSA